MRPVWFFVLHQPQRRRFLIALQNAKGPTGGVMELTPVITAWLGFLVCAVLIVIAGTFLSRYGDVIADKTGLGGTWIGLILLASVTSLPELVTGASAVTLAEAPNLA